MSLETSYECVVTYVTEVGTILRQSSVTRRLVIDGDTTEAELAAAGLAEGVRQVVEAEGWTVNECRASEVGTGGFLVEMEVTVPPAEISETRVERDGRTSLTSVTRKYPTSAVSVV